MHMFGRKKQNSPVVPAEHESMARLEQAEAEVALLKQRAANAIEYLDGRSKRNHWRQAVIETIQGV